MHSVAQGRPMRRRRRTTPDPRLGLEVLHDRLERGQIAVDIGNDRGPHLVNFPSSETGPSQHTHPGEFCAVKSRHTQRILRKKTNVRFGDGHPCRPHHGGLDLDRAEAEHLRTLCSSWQVLADLSFSDLLLTCPGGTTTGSRSPLSCDPSPPRPSTPRTWSARASRSPSTFSLVVLLASIGTAWLTSLAGLSMAVGAFLAGLVLAESEVSHQVHAEVRPLRDLLASLFFISVGMLVDPATLAARSRCSSARGAHPPRRRPSARRSPLPGRGHRCAWRPPRLWPSLVWGVLAALWRERSRRRALHAERLAAAAGREHPHDDGGAGPRDARAGVRRARGSVVVACGPIGTRGGPPKAGHVVILGYGVGGRLVARAVRTSACLRRARSQRQTVREAMAAGEPLVYADVTAPDALEAAGVGTPPPWSPCCRIPTPPSAPFAPCGPCRPRCPRGANALSPRN